MKRLAFSLAGAVSSTDLPPKDESSTFYVDLTPNYLGGNVVKLTIGGQDLNLSPTTLMETIAVSGSTCKTSKTCNTPNTYDRSKSETFVV